MIAKKIKEKWHVSLNSQALIGLGILSIGLIGSFMFTINTEGKKLVFFESSRLIQQTGDSAISDLTNRLTEVDSLARTLGTTAEELTKSETTFKNFIPEIINFQGDLGIAGGGIWPEPYQFNSKVEKRSFFWGRTSDGTLKYYDDYNLSGYHNADWYVIARYLKRGQCFWSRSYIDPFSLQPMVTCTVATKERGNFSGATTIDVKLDGLQAFTEFWQNKTGGYVFIVDRDNRFISFPDTKLVQRVEKDAKGGTKREFITAFELAAVKPKFSPIAKALEAVNQDLLKQVQKMPSYKPEIIANLQQASKEINQQQAEFMDVVLADPLAGKIGSTRLLKQVEIPNDWWLKEESTVYIFHVPKTYWKLVIVKPVSQSVAVADSIAKFLVNRAALIVVLGAFFALVTVRFQLIKPLQSLNKASKEIELNLSQIVESNWQQELPTHCRNEIGDLAQTFRSMAEQLKQSFDALRESEATNRAIVTAIPDLMIRAKSNGTYLDIIGNAPSRQFLLGKTVEASLPSELAQLRMHHIQQALSTGELQVYEQHLTINGKTQDEEVRILVLGEDEVLIMVRDITARKQAEESLRIAEENYRSIFENALEGIFQSSPKGQFISVNPALAKIYGYASPAEMIDSITNIREQLYVDSEKQDEFIRLLDKYGSVKDFELRCYCQDRSIIWTEIDARVVKDSKGQVLYYEGIVQEITERKRREEELRRQLEELKIEIDHKQREKEVAMLTESNYFQEVKQEMEDVNLDEFWS